MAKRTGRMIIGLTVLAAAAVPTLTALAILVLVRFDAPHPLAQSFLDAVYLPAPPLVVAAVVLVAYLPWVTILAILIDRDRRVQIVAPLYRRDIDR